MLKGLIRRTRTLWAIAATVLLGLAIGHFATGPRSAAPRNQFDEILPRAAIQVPHLLKVQVLLPSGAPAVSAVVVMVEPELAAAHTDSEGMAQLSHLTTGPFRLQAYLPHHELLLVGPGTAEEMGTLQLLERELKEIPSLLPETLVRVDLEILDQNGDPLPDVVLRTVPASQLIQSDPAPTNLAPWISISDANGWARLEGVPEIDLRMEAYAPSLPISPAWLLGSRTITPIDGDDFVWKIPVTSLHLSNLPAGELLRGRRIHPDGKLPLTRTPANGTVLFPVIPPGEYHFTVVKQSFTIKASAGKVVFRFNQSLPKEN